MDEVLLCPTTWDNYHRYKEAVEMVLGVSPEKSTTIDLVKMPHDRLRAIFDVDPALRTLGPSWTRKAREYIADRLPPNIPAGKFVRHILIYHVLRALPLITDRLFISPEGELFEGVPMSDLTIAERHEAGKHCWMREDVTVVKPGDRVMHSYTLEYVAQMDVVYQAGDSPGSLRERAFDLRCDGRLIAPSECNTRETKSEVVK